MQAVQPFIDKLQDEKWPRLIAFIVMGVGIALRVKMFLMNRSLFIDEANLAINIFDRGYLELLQPLSREQFVPPIFLWFTEFISRFIGATEYAVRLYPLICGILAIPLFYRITNKLQHPWFALYPLVVFCFNDFVVKYSVTFKQYSSDVLVTLLFLAMALHYTSMNTGKRFLFWLLAGMGAIWLSMPVVFILSGVGIYYLVNGWRAGKNNQLVYTSLAIAGWLVSFGAYFLVLLKHQVGSEYLQDFHEGYFLPFPPMSAEELQTFTSLSLQFVVILFNNTVLAYLWGIVTVLAAIYAIYKRYASQIILLVLPIVACYAASALNFYSLIPRLTLFLLPLFLILISVGAETLFRMRFQFNQVLKIAIVVVMVITAADAGAYTYFANRHEREEIKQLLRYFNDNKTNEQYLYVHHGAEPAFELYTKVYTYRENFSYTNVYEAEEWEHDQNIEKKFSSYPEDAEVWVLFTNTWPHQQARWLNPLKKNDWEIIEQKEVNGGTSYLLTKK